MFHSSSRLAIISLAVLFGLFSVADTRAANRPNVVFVITDDQGYGDLSCHGNPVLRTPHLDQLHGESVRLTDYHVSPTCSPTRAALLTGHWTNRTGVWHTIMGRSMLREDEVTMADVFRDSGYTTGMFGKWHLGDNYPYRAEDRGFDEVMRHGGGGVGQTPDFWNNAYFDGSYFHNGTPEAVRGFCTDVFFDYAKTFIKDCKKEDEPFFAYLATNAPHGPMHAPETASAPYADHPVALANFYGMIANIDSNVGKLRQFLQDEGLADNTLFIFTTDNGSSSGWKVFNAGMRAGKGSEYDGGHRVPFFVHWPAGNLAGGRDVTPITGHVDILPTLIELCQLQNPQDVKFDGVSLAPLLREEPAKDWPDRILVTDSQRVKDPIKWRKSSVMTNRWRLINRDQLYDIVSDPDQSDDVSSRYPDVVNRLRDFYESWWAELEGTFADSTAIYLGHPAAPEVKLTSHDWITTGSTPWNQAHIRKALRGDANTGFWNVKIVTPGRYRVRLRRWPSEADTALGEALPPGDDVPGVKPYRATPGKSIHPVRASLAIGDVREQSNADADEHEVVFDVDLPEGETTMTATFETAEGQTYGAYYASVTLESD